MSDEPKKCIFCPFVGKLTHEHIWGDWTRDHVPRPHNKHNFKAIIAKTPTEEVHGPVRTRAGDALNSQVRIVCGPCNSGWMGQIQERARPYLVPLFDGHESILDSNAQTRIATWATMATMTGEHLSYDTESVAVPQSERDWFRKNGVPPDNWRILIGRYQRQAWREQWRHVSIPIYSAKDIPGRKASNRREPNHQATTFTVGQLYVHVFSGHFRNLIMDWDWRTAPRARSCLTQIWPIQFPLAMWPTQDMTDADAEAFSMSFVRWSGAIAEKFGWH